jgi:HK97 family phage prohead protease
MVATFDKLDEQLERLLTVTHPDYRPNLQHKDSFTSPVTALTGNTIAGYAAVWADNTGIPFVDEYGDMTVQGSWQDTITAANQERKATGRPHLMPYLYNQAISSQLGGVTALYEDSKGVAYESKLARTAKAQEVYELARSGFLGTSYGYLPTKHQYIQHGGKRIRVLQKVSVMELSAVTSPANPYATAQAKAGRLFKSSPFSDVKPTYLSPDGMVNLEKAMSVFRKRWQGEAERLARQDRMQGNRQHLGELANSLERFIDRLMEN